MMCALIVIHALKQGNKTNRQAL